MTALPSYFDDFLQEIRLTRSQVEELKVAHTTLRERLLADEDMRAIIVSTFLHGSYRRATAIRPEGDARADVDVIVVTKLDRTKYTPQQVFDKIEPFLEGYGYAYEPQSRSFKISFEEVDLDLVPTSAPSEVDQKAYRSESVLTLDSVADNAGDWRYNDYWVSSNQRDVVEAASRLYKAAKADEWKTEPLWIPDRDRKAWQATHPLAQLLATRDKNKACRGHFVNVVKAVKWWRRAMHPEPKRPKGYPLERIVFEGCPEGVMSVAHGLTKALENTVEHFRDEALRRKPFLRDHGVDQNVLERIDGDDFQAFYEQVELAAIDARTALEEVDPIASAELWHQLLGDAFPEPPGSKSDNDAGSSGGDRGGYIAPVAPANPRGGRFA